MSRVKKFKDYRNSLQNNSEDVLLTQPIDITKDIDDERLTAKKPNTESLSTLSVSYDEIMEAANKVDENNQPITKEKREIDYPKILKICGIVLLCIAVAVALIILGIYAF